MCFLSVLIYFLYVSMYKEEKKALKDPLHSSRLRPYIKQNYSVQTQKTSICLLNKIFLMFRNLLYQHKTCVCFYLN